MTRKTLKDEIQQTRPFASPEAEVYLNLMRTTEALALQPTLLLRDAGLSPSQYNVLRILRGAGASGLACREIVDRMVTRDSDMTRLLDGLEKKRLVKRERSTEDRRIIVVQINRAGLALLAELDEPLERTHVEQLSHLGSRKLRTLSRLLEEARQQPDDSR